MGNAVNLQAGSCSANGAGSSSSTIRSASPVGEFQRGCDPHTTDGGLTWTRKPVNDAQGNANLEASGFIDENHGWVGAGAAALHGGFSSETDGGDHW
jgi:hypothetical protein